MKFKYEDIRKIAVLFNRTYEVYKITDVEKEKLQKAFPDSEIKYFTSMEALSKEMPDANALFAYMGFDYSEYVKNDPDLVWIHDLIAGTDFLDVPEITENDKITVTNTSGIHAKPIAELVMAFILYKLKAFRRTLNQQQSCEWFTPWPDEIEGKTVAVIGVGKMGKVIAEKCKLMGFRVIGYKRTEEKIDYLDELYTGKENLEKVLAQSDFVVNILPGTKATKNFFTEKEFIAMKKGAYYINVGRGMTTNTYALMWALENGMISGCALDVTDPEPLPADHPLWKMEHCTITPHMAGNSPKFLERAFDLVITEVERLKNGEEMTNIVKFEK